MLPPRPIDGGCLFNIEQDPTEHADLANDPAHTGISYLYGLSQQPCACRHTMTIRTPVRMSAHTCVSSVAARWPPCAPLYMLVYGHAHAGV